MPSRYLTQFQAEVRKCVATLNKVEQFHGLSAVHALVKYVDERMTENFGAADSDHHRTMRAGMNCSVQSDGSIEFAYNYISYNPNRDEWS